MAAYLVVANYEGLTNSYMTTEQRATIEYNSTEWLNRVAGSKIQVTGWSLFVVSLWLVKFSLAVFYSRLTYVLKYSHGIGSMNRNAKRFTELVSKISQPGSDWRMSFCP